MEAGTDVGAMREHESLTGLLTLVLIQPRTTCPGAAPLRVGWALLYQSFIKKVLTGQFKIPYSPVILVVLS